ncbi:cyclic AMP-responsive element-binding protein 3-like protein 4 isoform 2-T2 [Odontesthes bonariensis]|uniref:cyclic AMP-responsive element-binding protein 3-like protein 4 isoform X2 n=1 Tax=Odontesthes bonariensis TaxID=219752 RepID=UPI003F58D82C
MDAESGELFLGCVAAGGWQLDVPPSCSEQKPLQDWAVDPDGTLNDSESEDDLYGVDPNAVFSSGPAADRSSESDSGISEEPVVESPVATVTAVNTATGRPTSATVFQVVYDISAVGGAEPGPGQENVISIELDEWSSQLLLSDSCIVNELPVVSAARPPGSLTGARPHDLAGDLLFPDLRLTEEEQKLLTEEGMSLPGNKPLTKAEERILKKVRRKIRNKQSAQDSRRRRKEYIDGLENRAAACSAQNKELQRTVEQLEKHNMSLLAQLRQLQSLIKQTVSKGAQTSTCLLIILVSLGLIILPSFSPFSRRPSADEDYRPTGVISRNILTDPASSQLTADGAGGPTDSTPPPPDLSQSGPPGGAAVLREPVDVPEKAASDGGTYEGSQSGNVSAAVQVTRKGGHDTTKHADEM